MKKLLLVVVCLLALGGVAQAAIPSADGSISACYLTSGNPNARGALRVIDAEAGESCASGETAVTLDAGPDQPVVMTLVKATSSVGFPGTTNAAVSCPSGTYPTGGGFRVIYGPGPPLDDLNVLVDRPEEWPAGSFRWFVQLKSNDTRSVDIEVRAVCAGGIDFINLAGLE